MLSLTYCLLYQYGNDLLLLMYFAVAVFLLYKCQGISLFLHPFILINSIKSLLLFIKNATH